MVQWSGSGDYSSLLLTLLELFTGLGLDSSMNIYYYSTVLFTMLYITFLGLASLIIGSLYLLITFTHFPRPFQPPPLTTTNLFSVFVSLVFFLFHIWVGSYSICFSLTFYLAYCHRGSTMLLQMARFTAFNS